MRGRCAIGGIIGVVGLSVGCTTASIFSDIGTNMANPLTVAVNPTLQRAYIVNSNAKYLYTAGSLHVVDLSTITSPTLVQSKALESFGGGISLDATNNMAYIADRLSDDDLDTTDQLLQINVAEGSSAFLSVSASEANDDPFGVAFDATNNQLAVATRAGTLDIYTVSGSGATRVAQVDLNRALDNGEDLSSVEAIEAVIMGTQAVVTLADGGVLVVNMTEATASGVNPVDYYISDIESPRGIAVSGTTLFVVSVTADGENLLLQLDVSSLAADDSNTTTAVKDKDTAGLLVTSYTVGENPQEVVVSGTTAYVSNLDADSVSVVDTGAASVSTITVGEEPFGLAIYQEVVGTDSHVLVCNLQSNSVSIIALASNAVVATYP
ncbi:MAG: hypothetical protein HYV02_05625 [Deltaproteobacteria bacterium]|nr:hypothetical protein [Deltaproteobacteria bacterium]